MEPQDKTTAEDDYERWGEYIAECKEQGVKPKIQDFIVWLEEHDVSTAA